MLLCFAKHSRYSRRDRTKPNSFSSTFLSHVLFEELGGTPIGIGKLLAAKAEIATVSAFVLYLCTYLETFRYAQIHFSISLRDNLGRSMSGVLLNEYGDDGAPTPLPIHES